MLLGQLQHQPVTVDIMLVAVQVELLEVLVAELETVLDPGVVLFLVVLLQTLEVVAMPMTREAVAEVLVK